MESKRLKIGIVSLSSGQLGDSVRIDQFCKSLTQMGFDAKVLNPYNDLLPSAVKHEGENTRLTTTIPRLWGKISRIPGFKSYAMERMGYETLFHILSKKLYYMVRKEDIDVLQAETLFAADITLPVKQALGLPMILDLHSGTFTEEIRNSVNPTAEFLHYCTMKQREILLGSDCIIVTSQGMKDQLKSDYGITNTRLAQNGATGWNGSRAPHSFPIRVIYAGIFAYWERVQDYLDAIKIIGNDEFEFYLAGDGYLKDDLMSKIADENIQVTYLGSLPREKLREKMAAMHIGVAPMAKEQGRKFCSSIKTYEYLSMGMPVVCADIGDWAKAVKDKDCGLVVPPEDPAAMAKAILSYRDGLLWERQSSNGRRLVVEKYSWEEILGSLKPVYNDLAIKIGR